MINYKCPKCGKSTSAADVEAGKERDCPSCGEKTPVPLKSILKGTEIGGFSLADRLGEGSMGEVWLAHQKAFDREVALKILPLDMTRDQEALQRFLSEVRISGKLMHPNIVKAIDAGTDKGVTYLAIDYIDGEDLDLRLQCDVTIPEKEALRIARKISDALRYAWNEHKILHRDIKPSNIMIARGGEPMLMDMGISKCLSEEQSLTVTGTVLGTPYYMSPEQGKALKDIDFRTDIYALGASLFHLVTGTVPYEGNNPVTIMSRHITEKFPDPLERNPELSKGCAELLEIMMAKRPEDRQDSWDEVIADLDQVLEGQSPLSASKKLVSHCVGTLSPAALGDMAAQTRIDKPGATASGKRHSEGEGGGKLILAGIIVAVFFILAAIGISIYIAFFR